MPAGLLKAGENVLAIKVSHWGARAGVNPMAREGKLEQHQFERLEKIEAYMSIEAVRYVEGLYLDMVYLYDDPYRCWRW